MVCTSHFVEYSDHRRQVFQQGSLLSLPQLQDTLLSLVSTKILVFHGPFTLRPLTTIPYILNPVPLGFQPANVNATAAAPVVRTAPGVPFGLAFMGTAFSEFKLISYAFAYEQATHTRLRRLAFDAAIPKTQLVDVIGI